MAIGAPLISSDTQPVREVLSHGVDALLAPFDQPERLAASLQACLLDREATLKRVAKAQERSLQYDASLGLEGWTRLLGSVR